MGSEFSFPSNFNASPISRNTISYIRNPLPNSSQISPFAAKSGVRKKMRYLAVDTEISYILNKMKIQNDNRVKINEIYRNIFTKEDPKSKSEKNLINEDSKAFESNEKEFYCKKLENEDDDYFFQNLNNRSHRNTTYIKNDKIIQSNNSNFKTEGLFKKWNSDVFTFVEDIKDVKQEKENIRNKYLAKLIYKNIWEINNTNQNMYTSIFIFDWDDTLLPTSFITPNGCFTDDYVLDKKFFPIFSEIDKNASILLNLAISNGKTFIVTNAVSGWVELSAKRFLPEVSKILSKVTIISARRNFEFQFPGNSRKWKIETFLEIQKCFTPNKLTNLICIGDSIIEMEAAHVISKKFENLYLKTVKFKDGPKPEELNKEIKLVITNFNMIYSAIKNLTVNVERKKE